MLIEQRTQLPIPSAVAVNELAELPGRELVRLVAAATSSGEALLERSGLARLDEANQCHFGGQLGRPFSRNSLVAFQLRWWNDKSRSLTPGFIGEVVIRSLGDHASELAIVGQYHPRAHLYELVDRRFLDHLGTAVVSSFLDLLREKLLASIEQQAAEAQPLAS
jgi:hypothetical protein